MQAGLGQTGRFGEIFVALAILMAVGGFALLGYSLSGGLDDSAVGGDAARGDALILYLFLFVMALGFGLFGILALLLGWGRHHEGFEW